MLRLHSIQYTYIALTDCTELSQIQKKNSETGLQLVMFVLSSFLCSDVTTEIFRQPGKISVSSL